MGRSFFVAFALSVSLVGCGTSGGSAAPDASDDADGVDASADDASDAGAADASPDVDKTAMCATTFGTALFDAFGRVDGTVVAVLPPNDQACTAPNKTHMIIEVMMNGAVYRMVVDVLSTVGSPDVAFTEIDAPLVAGAWSEGWHTGIALDYVTTLNVHSPMFTAMHQLDLVAKITSEIDIGAKISVYSTSAGESDSTHLVHRNITNADGAIVIRPDSATPHWMLLRFPEQTF